jgi:predicted DNA-binding transcriptional regulator YafY
MPPRGRGRGIPTPQRPAASSDGGSLELDHEDGLVGTALAVRSEEADVDGRLRVELTFQDRRHAEWALWQLGADAEALSPPILRTALHARATALAARYAP